MQTMKAAIFESYGGPEVLHLAQVPRPVPGPGEALVRVHAVALNGFDLMARQGRYKPNKGRFPHILGGDFAGELVELGAGARTDLIPGARVTAWSILPCGICEQCRNGFPNRCARDYRYLGAHEPGGSAEFIKLPAANLIALPDAVDDLRAAAFPVAYGTAWRMVKRADVRPGETVVINAASSGVSLAAIQICKLAGAHVIATSTADWKLDRVREIGADEVINSADTDMVAEVMARTGKRGVDVVIEHVGGDYLDKSIRCLTRGGRLVTTGGTKSYECTINVSYVFHKELNILGSNSFNKTDLETMIPLLAAGKLDPVIDRVFPLADAAEAHRYLETASQFGKVLLEIGQ